MRKLCRSAGNLIYACSVEMIGIRAFCSLQNYDAVGGASGGEETNYMIGESQSAYWKAFINAPLMAR